MRYLLLILEILFLLGRVIFALGSALYRLIISPQEIEIKDKIVLITGAARGIGRELAFQYGKMGAVVVCVDISEELNKETVEQLHRRKIKAFSYVCDVSNPIEVEELKLKVEREVGNVAVLVNNAGIFGCKPLLQQSTEEINRMFQINIIGQVYMIRAFLPTMIKKGDGHVVAISSAAGLKGQANSSTYSSTKFAVRGMMESMEEESRQNKWPVKWTTVCPFFVATGMCKKKLQKIRFQFVLNEISTEEVAAQIILAQRRGCREVSLPRMIRPSVILLNILPDAAATSISHFFDIGVLPDN